MLGGEIIGIEEIEEAIRLVKRSKLQIELLETTDDVQDYKDELTTLEKLTTILSDLTSEAGQNATEWESDTFTQGKKDIAWLPGRKIGIIRSTTNTRTIDPKLFVEKYPLHANIMIEKGDIKIPIGKIEPEIGKNAVTEISTVKTTYKYELEVRNTPVPETKKKEEKKETKRKRKVAA